MLNFIPQVSSWNFLLQIQNYERQIETTVTCSLMCDREDGRLVLLGLKDGTYLCFSADTGILSVYYLRVTIEFVPLSSSQYGR